MEILAKTFSIVATYIIFVEKKSLLNKKFTAIFGLYRGALPNFDWLYKIWLLKVFGKISVWSKNWIKTYTC